MLPTSQFKVLTGSYALELQRMQSAAEGHVARHEQRSKKKKVLYV